MGPLVEGKNGIEVQKGEGQGVREVDSRNDEGRVAGARPERARLKTRGALVEVLPSLESLGDKT